MLKHIPQKEENISTYVYRTIKQSIIEFYFIPGDKINEALIAQELKTSRTPVREALILLENEGLIQIFPKRGTFVSKINISEANNFIFIRKNVEKEVFQIACNSLTTKHLEILHEELQAQKVMKKVKDGLTSMYLLDNSFIKFIYSLCGYEETWKILQKIGNSFNRIRILNCLNQSSGDDIYNKNKRILNLITEKNIVDLKKFIDNYLSSVEMSQLKLVKNYSSYFIV